MTPEGILMAAGGLVIVLAFLLVVLLIVGIMILIRSFRAMATPRSGGGQHRIGPRATGDSIARLAQKGGSR